MWRAKSWATSDDEKKLAALLLVSVSSFECYLLVCSKIKRVGEAAQDEGRLHERPQHRVSRSLAEWNLGTRLEKGPSTSSPSKKKERLSSYMGFVQKHGPVLKII